jgi:hypothetical protein
MIPEEFTLNKTDILLLCYIVVCITYEWKEIGGSLLTNLLTKMKLTPEDIAINSLKEMKKIGWSKKL